MFAWGLVIIMAASVGAGFLLGIDGARNLALFFLWIVGVGNTILGGIGLLVLMAANDAEKANEIWKESLKHRAQRKVPYHIPIWIDFPMDFAILIIIVWAGHWVLGIFFLLAMVQHHVYRHGVENYLFNALKEGYKNG